MKTYRASIAGDTTDLLIAWSDDIDIFELEAMLKDAINHLAEEQLLGGE